MCFCFLSYFVVLFFRSKDDYLIPFFQTVTKKWTKNAQAQTIKKRTNAITSNWIKSRIQKPRNESMDRSFVKKILIWKQIPIQKKM